MKVAIIGGAGKMGRWFARLLLKEGKEVILAGRNQNRLIEAGEQLGVEIASSEEAVKRADVIILSVPIESFDQVVISIAPFIRPGQIIVDVTSVKTGPVNVMHQYLSPALVLGTHPLFGPGARGLANLNIVLTPTTDPEAGLAKKVSTFLEDRGANVIVMSPEEHDKMMAVILGLSHFIALVSADTLASFDKLPEMKQISGITYRVLLTLIESVVSEDPALYATLQMSLPNLAGLEKIFQEKAGAWAELVSSKDAGMFIEKMTALKKTFEKNDPDFGKAYQNMYKLVNG